MSFKQTSFGFNFVARREKESEKSRGIIDWFLIAQFDFGSMSLNVLMEIFSLHRKEFLIEGLLERRFFTKLGEANLLIIWKVKGEIFERKNISDFRIL